MKKTLSVLLLMAACSANAQTQRIGLKAGFSRTDVSGTDWLGTTMLKNGFSGGLTYEYCFSKYFFAGAELQYQQRGYLSTIGVSNPYGPGRPVSVTATHRYDYLALPLKAGFRYGNKLFGFVSLAAVPALLAKGSVSLPAWEADGIVTEKQSYKDENANGFDFAGLAEIGGGYRVSKRYAFNAAVSYQQSFTSFTNTRHYGSVSAKQEALSFCIGLSYVLRD